MLFYLNQEQSDKDYPVENRRNAQEALERLPPEDDEE